MRSRPLGRLAPLSGRVGEFVVAGRPVFSFGLPGQRAVLAVEAAGIGSPPLTGAGGVSGVARAAVGGRLRPLAAASSAPATTSAASASAAALVVARTGIAIPPALEPRFPVTIVLGFAPGFTQAFAARLIGGLPPRPLAHAVVVTSS